MTSIKFYYLDESPVNPGKYVIRLDLDKLPPELMTSGSYNVLMARLLGLEWAQFLRFCRDMVGAEIYGKNHLYPVPYFNNDLKARKLVIALNSRLNAICWEITHPNQPDMERYNNWRARIGEDINYVYN